MSFIEELWHATVDQTFIIYDPSSRFIASENSLLIWPKHLLTHRNYTSLHLAEANHYARAGTKVSASQFAIHK